MQVEIVDDPCPGCIAVRVRVVGEVFDDLLVDAGVQPPPSAEEFRDRFVSNLSDFIAESKFGWGQNRAE